MGFRKKKFQEVTEDHEEMSLQITSMADIFTIILVFLLKSYSTSISNVSMGKNLTLPEAQAQAQTKDMLKVEISKNAVLVDQKAVAQLHGYAFDHTEEPQKAELIFQALMHQRQVVRQKPGAPGDSAIDVNDSHLLVVADQKTPYATLKTIMGSAARAGYVDLQLAVVQPN